MARSIVTSVENNFVNGYVTEATGLNFPENAVTESENCVFDEKGPVYRRLGIDLEDGFGISSDTTGEKAINEFLWESVGGDGSKTFHVQQVGSFLYFYQVASSGSLSNSFVGQLNLAGYATSGLGPLETNIFQFTAGKGYLFVVHPYMTPVYISYSSGTFTPNTIEIKTRDFIGVDDGIVGRLTSLSNAHYYNLYNQGWPTQRINEFYSQVGSYPSDYDVWWLYKNASEVFDPLNLANTIIRGNSPAPKGTIIMSEFFQDRGNLTDTGLSIPVVTSNGTRPSTVEFFAGRVFYSGVNYQGFNGKIYFSQIIERDTQFGECFQQNDPTSEISFDLLPTDGGVISVPEIGTVIRLWSIEGSLMVFASNGIWQIKGSSGIGFAANDYTVSKISTIETISPHSFVDMGGLPIWWTQDGIYTVAVNGQIGTTQVQSVSDAKIKKYFDTIPQNSKQFAKGAFNIKDKKVQWVYREEAALNITQQYTYTHILNFNVLSGAFYIWTVPTSPAQIRGIICVRGTGSTSANRNVFDQSGVIVTANDSTNVTVFENSTAALSSTFKYLTTFGPNSSNFAFCDETDGDYVDFATIPGSSGVPFESYFISGYKLRGEGQRKFQSNYITFYTDNEVPSIFYVNGVWDFSTSGDTGRWSTRQKVTQLGGDYRYAKKRVKIRGHGVVLQYQVRSFPGEPFEIIGWSAFESINGSL